MTRSSASARCIATVLSLLCASVLTACAPNSTRPAPVPTAPPRVDCQRSAPAQVPPIPELSQMDEWAIAAMAIIETERAKWAAEADCIAKLRVSRVIR